MFTFRYIFYDKGLFTWLYMGSELKFINYRVPVGSNVSLVWLNLPILEGHLTKTFGCFVDFTSEIRALVILLSFDCRKLAVWSWSVYKCREIPGLWKSLRCSKENWGHTENRTRSKDSMGNDSFSFLIPLKYSPAVRPIQLLVKWTLGDSCLEGKHPRYKASFCCRG